MSKQSLSGTPLPILAVVLIMGALGLGRSFLMLLLGWSAYQAGAVELSSYIFFVAHFVVGMVVLGVVVALVIRVRWAWVVALITTFAMLIEEMVRSVPLLAAGGGVTTTLVVSTIYVTSMVVMIVLLTTRSSRNFFQEAS